MYEAASPRNGKRRSVPQSKAASMPAKAAKRKSAPAGPGKETAVDKPASAAASKQQAEPEAPDTALPLSKRLENHKRTRNSDDSEPDAESPANPEPAKKKNKKGGRPISAPAGDHCLLSSARSGLCSCRAQFWRSS